MDKLKKILDEKNELISMIIIFCVGSVFLHEKEYLYAITFLMVGFSRLFKEYMSESIYYSIGFIALSLLSYTLFIHEHVIFSILVAIFCIFYMYILYKEVLFKENKNETK